MSLIFGALSYGTVEAFYTIIDLAYPKNLGNGDHFYSKPRHFVFASAVFFDVPTLLTSISYPVWFSNVRLELAISFFVIANTFLIFRFHLEYGEFGTLSALDIQSAFISTALAITLINFYTS